MFQSYNKDTMWCLAPSPNSENFDITSCDRGLVPETFFAHQLVNSIDKFSEPELSKYKDPFQCEYLDHLVFNHNQECLDESPLTQRTEIDTPEVRLVPLPPMQPKIISHKLPLNLHSKKKVRKIISKPKFSCLYCKVSYEKSHQLGGHVSRCHPGRSTGYMQKKARREERAVERGFLAQAKEIL